MFDSTLGGRMNRYNQSLWVRPERFLTFAILLFLVLNTRAQWVGVDPAFPAGSGPDNRVQCVAMQSDGRLLVGGFFTNFNGVAFLASLDTNRTVDLTFTPQLNDAVTKIVVQPDGRSLIFGQFTKVNGLSYPGLCRLLADGTPDTNFVPPKVQGTGSVGSVVAATDGAVWIGGSFTNLGGVSCNHAARLFENGLIDPACRSPFGVNDSVTVLTAQPNGKELISGSFTNIGGMLVTNLVRLNADGSVDLAFRSGLQPAERALRALLLPDGRFLLAVSTIADFGLAIEPPRLVRLNADGSVDPTFQVGFESPDSRGIPISVRSNCNRMEKS